MTVALGNYKFDECRGIYHPSAVSLIGLYRQAARIIPRNTNNDKI
jgi:hypothetical protein